VGAAAAIGAARARSDGGGDTAMRPARPAPPARPRLRPASACSSAAARHRVRRLWKLRSAAASRSESVAGPQARRQTRRRDRLRPAPPPSPANGLHPSERTAHAAAAASDPPPGRSSCAGADAAGSGRAPAPSVTSVLQGTEARRGGASAPHRSAPPGRSNHAKRRDPRRRREGRGRSRRGRPGDLRLAVRPQQLARAQRRSARPGRSGRRGPARWGAAESSEIRSTSGASETTPVSRRITFLQLSR
jgi:hypothetical protein